MSNLKLRKEPGFVYDLLTVFSLRYNKQLFVEELPVQDRDEYDKYYDEVLNNFGEVSEELFLFFYMLDRNHNFISTFYFKSYSDRFSIDYDVEYLLNTLLDRRVFVGNMIRFYLQDITDNELEKYLGSVVDLFSHVKLSSHSDYIKKKLYEFFINPDYYIQVLQHELMKKSMLLEEYYRENYDLIMAAYSRTTLDLLEEQFKSKRNLRSMISDESSNYISFCLVNKICANLFPLDNGVFFLVGQAFDMVHIDTESNYGVNLETLGSALCEDIRVKILKLIVKCGSLTCRDMEKIFEFSKSTIYHHVTLLVRSGAIKTHNEGKTIFYSINRDYFDSILKELSIYSNIKI